MRFKIMFKVGDKVNDKEYGIRNTNQQGDGG